MAVTLRDIARHLGISHATVSFVLNNRTDMGITEATRQRVLVAAQELGYKPNRAARALTTGRTDMLAVCLPSSGEDYYAEILHGIQSAMNASNYEVVVWQSEPQAEGRKKPADLNVDAFVAVDIDADDAAFTDDDGSRKSGVNVGTVPREGWDNVVIDVKDAASQALKHLLEVGCKKVAYLRPATDSEPNDSLSKTFRDLKAPNGVSLREIISPSRDRQSAMQAIKDDIKKSGPLDSILCATDSLAIAARRALAELGYQIPRDVAIVGCGGIEEAEYAVPPLSTISYPISSVSEAAWQMVRERLEQSSSQSQTRVEKATFIPRESSLGFGK